MHDVLRDRLSRKLDVLPEPQLYQVLDYIEFLESKYAPGRSVPQSALRSSPRPRGGMRSATWPQVQGNCGLMGNAAGFPGCPSGVIF